MPALNPCAVEGAPVGQHGREAREQHEHLGGVGEAEVAQGEPGEVVARHVVDENEQEREPAKEVDSQVSLQPWAGGAHGHRSFIQQWVDNVAGTLKDARSQIPNNATWMLPVPT